MKISENCVVSIGYQLADEAGNAIEASRPDAPLEYLHGANNIIPGLENALTGKAAGETVQVRVEPEDAYGVVNDALKQSVPREAFVDVDEIAVGMQFQAQSDSGQVEVVTVIEVNDETVTIDTNHPLAGQVLHFDVDVLSVREATETEIAHGHVHSAGGCSH
ncbi:FKBP-type peptidyl-prolyl cis-trans isomerase [Ostreibacterium oceani]|uniref:Peptidyl-prolyl cis-trans isomerase n=1 Tax=Ostreibacterium oceani TaxID=2654998 RepID=A0A6N7ETE3_9GAMM|nr:peptidylprolyl isomerase [Ostreibacterium oceani]MPV85702.1 peptidylprolyl isomerase [Ostreibacterium oceani]